MIKYSLNKIEEIQGKYTFYKLLIDDNCQYDEFEANIKEEGNLANQLNTIQTRMQMLAEGHRLPKEKFRDITPNPPKKKKESAPPIVKEYEIKTDNLRVYLIEHVNSGKIIILAGKKTNQDKDIKRFRRIKEDYLASLAE